MDDATRQALANAIARRDAIWAELANTQFGPNVSEQGRTVDLVGYRKSLYDELDMLNKQINQLSWAVQGPVYGVVRG